MRRVLAMLSLLGLTQCTSTPPPAPPLPPVVKLPAVPVAVPVVSAELPPVDVEKKAHGRPLPPPRLVSAGAVIVWIADAKARGGFRSALVEAAADGSSKVIAERPEVIMASSKELWVLRTKKLRGLSCLECDKCLTDPPTCKKNETTTAEEPFLVSLQTGRILEPWATVGPWHGTFVPSRGCADSMSMREPSVTLTAAVGPVFFAEVGASMMPCGAAHPGSESNTLVYDLDAEAPIRPSFPTEPILELRRAAHEELTAEPCAMDPDATPDQYEASAAYGADGVLHGVFSFTMNAPYYCGTGPGHYSLLSTQTSPWVPDELLAYGKLPAFAASYLAAKKASFAMPIAPGRVASAEKEMAQK